MNIKANDGIPTKIYKKRDDLDFDIFNFSFLNGDVPRRTSLMQCLYLNLFVLPEHLRTLVPSIFVTKANKRGKT